MCDTYFFYFSRIWHLFGLNKKKIIPNNEICLNLVVVSNLRCVTSCAVAIHVFLRYVTSCAVAVHVISVTPVLCPLSAVAFPWGSSHPPAAWAESHSHMAGPRSYHGSAPDVLFISDGCIIQNTTNHIRIIVFCLSTWQAQGKGYISY